MVDELLRDLPGIPEPFGGKVIVFGGDSRQTRPIVPGGTPRAIIDVCVFDADFWENVRTSRLTQNMRLRTLDDLDPRVRGQAQHFHMNKIYSEPIVRSRNTLIYRIFPNLEGLHQLLHEVQRDFFQTRMIIAPHNNTVDELNDLCLSEI